LVPAVLVVVVLWIAVPKLIGWWRHRDDKEQPSEPDHP
jgi:hypothetical protein